MGRSTLPPPLYVIVGMDLHFLEPELASSNSLGPLSAKELAHNRFRTNLCDDVFLMIAAGGATYFSSLIQQSGAMNEFPKDDFGDFIHN